MASFNNDTELRKVHKAIELTQFYKPGIKVKWSTRETQSGGDIGRNVDFSLVDTSDVPAYLSSLL